MKRWIVVVLLAGAFGCSKKEPKTKPAEPVPEKSEPAAKTDDGDGDECLKKCMADGPDSDPGTVEDWKKGNAEERQSICDEQCAGGDSPPVDQVDEMNK